MPGFVIALLAVILAESQPCLRADGGSPDADPIRVMLHRMDGEWTGEITINSPDGFRLRTFPAARHVWWDGATQIVETAFSENGQTYSTRHHRWVSLGRVYSVIERPQQQETKYTATPTKAGFIWSHAEQSGLTTTELFSSQPGPITLETHSLEPIRMPGLSGLVTVEGVFHPASVTSAVQPSAELPTAAAPAGSATHLETVEQRSRANEISGISAGPALPSQHSEPIVTVGAARLTSASVEVFAAVDSRPASRIPVEVSDLAPGHHIARFSREGFRPATDEFEVHAGETTLVEHRYLEREAGVLSIDSIPQGARFTLRPARTLTLADAMTPQSGITPAKLEDLPPGEYTLEMQLDGAVDHTENISLRDAELGSVKYVFRRGAVRITSTPVGAQVLVNGAVVGLTPLSLDDVPLGVFSCSLALADHESVTVHGQVTSNGPLELALSLKPIERFVRADELDALPVAIKTVNPGRPEHPVDAAVLISISVLIDRDGVPHDPRVVRGAANELEQLCSAALLQWRFKPPTIGGKPASVRIAVPFAMR